MSKQDQNVGCYNNHLDQEFTYFLFCLDIYNAQMHACMLISCPYYLQLQLEPLITIRQRKTNSDSNICI